MALDPMLVELRADPSRAGLLFDVDGTLAPIVDDPPAARVPDATRDLLVALAGRYALVACVTGRPAATARLMVGVDAITYAGNHGLELLDPGAAEPRPDPALDGRERAAAQFVAGLDAAALAEAGIDLEDKGPIQALHWRRAPEPAIAQAAAERIGADADAAGLVPHWGRMVLEVRPLATVNKGTATARLIAAAGVARAMFAGDDRTDLDAFAALRGLERSRELERAVCVGVGSAEAPPELRRAADVLVDGTDELRDLLREL